MSENGVISTVMLPHLSQFTRLMVHYNLPKELFPCLHGIFFLVKVSFLFLSKITQNYIRNAILFDISFGQDK